MFGIGRGAGGLQLSEGAPGTPKTLRPAANDAEVLTQVKSKVFVLLAGGVVSLLLISRYFALSRAGVPLGWMLYLGLPVTGAGMLFALLLVDLGAGWSPQPDTLDPDCGILTHPLAPSLSERLKELEDLRARGIISDCEYRTQRLDIISGT
jgi:hypothetical protein